MEKTVTSGTGGKIIIDSAGTWKLIDSSLYVVLSESKWHVDGMKDKVKAKSMNKKLEAKSYELMQHTNDLFPVEIKWDNDDQISFDVKGTIHTYVRKK